MEERMNLTDAGLREHVVDEIMLELDHYAFALRDAARAEQREAIVKIVQAQEEMDGSMPDTIWNACVTRDGCAEVLRAAVRVTKRNIIAAIRAQGETR